MNHYCTLFDSNYLTRGLAMYRSLEATGESFTLYVVCFDTLCFDILTALKLPHAFLVPVRDIESPDLLRVKGQRSRAEYCWTCTSHVIRYFLDTFKLDRITYLDADMFFYGRPEVLLAECDRSGASVLITSHRYSPQYNHAAAMGIYCVQFMTFKADAQGMTALQWWQDRCIEWCYARLEDGKFGDQKYLDDWPTRFKGIHVLEHLGGGVAPWNVQQYRISSSQGTLRVNNDPLIFYHFHYYKYFTDGIHDFSHYRLTREVIDLIYIPYSHAVRRAEIEIRSIRPDFTAGYAKRSGRYFAASVLRRLRGTYNVYTHKPL